MFPEASTKNKRIAKNTLLLYFRMGITMIVSLFTSRVVLNTLGVEDYGVYNVVGGVVAMFGFISGPMAGTTQRYITFALGYGDEKWLRNVFSTALQIQVLLAFIIFVLGEALGLWFLYNKIKIPEIRLDAAFWVLQCSIASSVVMIMSIPYNAAIIAHEKMSAFAYISILEVILKLMIVYFLVVFSVDKLILYAFLILAIQVLICFCYNTYCTKEFPETKYKYVWDKKLMAEMTGFAGWGLFGNLSAILYSQGLNILLNLFFGPVVNAARAVAVQVQGAIQQFVGNFQVALNPQITKTYAHGEMQQMHQLMFRSARFSFFLLFFLSLPVLFETEYILTIWLKTVPKNAVIFTRIMICTSLIFTCANPMIVANQATGKVRKYQTVCGGILLTILPISYVLLANGFPAYSVFIVHFCVESVAQIARMVMLRPLIGLSLYDYFKSIYLRITIVVAVAIILPSFVHFVMPYGPLRFLCVGSICVMSVSSAAYFFGMSYSEQMFIRSKVTSFKKRFNKRRQI